MIEEILAHASVKTLVLTALVVFALVRVSRRINNEVKIRALGGHAYSASTWLPGGTSLF